MANAKMDLIREFQADLIGTFPDDVARYAADVLSMRLNEYDVTPACRELMVVETESQQMLRNYLATKKIEGRSDLTIKRYGEQLHKMMNAIHKPIVDIGVYDLRSYLASLSINGQCANTVAGIRSIICGFFTWLTNEGAIPKNPSAQLAVIKVPAEIKHPFTSTDIDKLRTACGKSLRDRALVEFLRSSGCRVSEVAELNRNAIDWVKLEVVVHGKGNKYRTVYIDDVCAMHVTRYLSSRADDDMALFVGKTGARMTSHGIREAVARIGEVAGVENVHPHRFRRTLATNLAVRGMPVQDIARILGHSNIDTTMVYVSMNDANVKMSYKRYSA